MQPPLEGGHPGHGVARTRLAGARRHVHDRAAVDLQRRALRHEARARRGRPLELRRRYDRGHPCRQALELHAHLHGPGDYLIRLWTTDAEGNRYDWDVPVRVYPALRPSIEVQGSELVARTTGGAEPMLAYRWRFDNGETAYGRRVVPPAGATVATLRVTDAAGTVAEASYSG